MKCLVIVDMICPIEIKIFAFIPESYGREKGSHTHREWGVVEREENDFICAILI